LPVPAISAGWPERAKKRVERARTFRSTELTKAKEKAMTLTTPIRTGERELDLRVQQTGEGPDVLLIAGTSDPIEAWQFQLDGLSDRYRLTAFDNRGSGRSPLPEGPLSVAGMADDAAAVLRAVDVSSTHVVAFSMGTAIAQELALRHPELVRSLVLMSTFARPDALLRAQLNFWRWLPEVAPSDRAFVEAFFTWVYTPRAHADGSVNQIVDDALAFPYQQSVEGFQAQVDACLNHDTADRLSQIDAPTLVLAGELDVLLPPHVSRSVAEAIPNARFEVMPGEAHQPFQEVPDDFNARVDAFLRDVEAGER
jgi:pimeloyl-ACP methyl ester carboxylesterase